MAFRRILTAVAIAASALLVAPTAYADQADPADTDQAWYRIQSYTVRNDVWDQTNWDWDPIYPTIAHPSHGGANQQWSISDDGTFLDREYGWCATAVDGVVAGRACEHLPEQRWKGSPSGDYEYWLIELEGTGLCVTHDGTYAPLRLANCDFERHDQRWIIGSV
ncbi:ricin-type beta-trefoil lectin domain protein [Actinosynnema sp. NPDC053489]|uniref:ricin-type beta-trefoil lectin domain protein n=1 Tax=Actinosynnema sp. NPDC053489 TaxID=3363916 RepID=UPI0037C7279F